jgi:hypothetical protein
MPVISMNGKLLQETDLPVRSDCRSWVYSVLFQRSWKEIKNACCSEFENLKFSPSLISIPFLISAEREFTIIFIKKMEKRANGRNFTIFAVL